jgi:hypothetical protein
MKKISVKSAQSALSAAYFFQHAVWNFKIIASFKAKAIHLYRKHIIEQSA